MFTSSLSNFSHDLDDSIPQIYAGIQNGPSGMQDANESNQNEHYAHSEACHKEYIFSEAGDFLKTQQQRLCNIERHLLRRIEDILPVESDLMTATELVQVCQRLHIVNLGFARHLQSIHRGDDQSAKEVDDDPNVSLNDAQSVRFSSGGPLLSVVEVDYETDATATPIEKCDSAKSTNSGQASTPGSRSSSIASQRTQSLSLPDSADFIEAWRYRQSLNCATATDSLETSMRSENPDCTNSTDRGSESLEVPQPNPPSTVHDTIAQEFGDDYSERDSPGTTTVFHDDESVSLAPTVKGLGFFKKQAMEQRVHDLHLDTTARADEQNLPSEQVSRAPISELVLEEEDDCFLEQGDLTFDRSVLTEQSISSPTRSRIHEIGDESLLVTPVLSRYRLEPDDSSIGVRVVPRDASSGHHRVPKSRSQFSSTVQRGHGFASNDTRKRPEALNTSCLDDKENVLHRIDEAVLLSPNVSVRTPQKGGRFGFGEGVLGERVFKSTKQSGESVKYDSFSRRHLTADQVIMEDSSQTGRRDLTQRFDDGSVRRQTVDAAGIRPKAGKTLITIISFEEYDSAPSVVRMQVGFEEINAAVHVLNLWFEATRFEGSRTLNEETGAGVLNTSQRKSKITLMSLCHWRRLNMYMDEGAGTMQFIPNQKQRSPRLTV